jgi:hypothetical protein
MSIIKCLLAEKVRNFNTTVLINCTHLCEQFGTTIFKNKYLNLKFCINTNDNLQCTQIYGLQVNTNIISYTEPLKKFARALYIT